MNKDEFNDSSIDLQVTQINLLISQLGSFRKSCEDVGIAKTTVLDRFIKNGYVFNKELKKYILNMDVEKVPESGKEVDYNSLDDCVVSISNKLNGIAKSFIEIGTILVHIQENKLFSQRGYDNLLSFTEAEFSLSKTQTYNLISVSKKFSIDGMLKEGYDNFSFSQLVEMLSLSESEFKLISDDMEVKDIRKIKNNKTKKSEEVEEVEEVEEEPNIFSNINNNTIDSILKVLQNEWANALNDDYADGLNRAISIVRDFIVIGNM